MQESLMQRSQFPHQFVGCDPYELHENVLQSYQSQLIELFHPLPKYLGLKQILHQLQQLHPSLSNQLLLQHQLLILAC
jgi:hypothetical protein